ncbi:hypothetical protein AU254_20945, partial [Yersinia pestis]
MTCSRRPCRTPREAAGVDDTAYQGLDKPGFPRAGGAAHRHIEVGVTHAAAEQVDKRQLVAVGRC